MKKVIVKVGAAAMIFCSSYAAATPDGITDKIIDSTEKVCVEYKDAKVCWYPKEKTKDKK